MSLPSWPIFMKLQASIAYGESLASSGDTTAVTEYLARLRKDKAIRRSLIIGPGDEKEVRALAPFLGELCALTLHPPEAAAIRIANVDVGDIHNMPYQNGVFDFLFASNVLEHAFAPYVALMECRRVLASDGIAYFIMPSFAGAEGGTNPFHLHCLTRQVWTELLRKCGLALTDVVVEQGQVDDNAHYLHFRCAVTDPPHPHNAILQELRTLKGSP